MKENRKYSEKKVVVHIIGNPENYSNSVYNMSKKGENSKETITSWSPLIPILETYKNDISEVVVVSEYEKFLDLYEKGFSNKHLSSEPYKDLIHKYGVNSFPLTFSSSNPIFDPNIVALLEHVNGKKVILEVSFGRKTFTFQLLFVLLGMHMLGKTTIESVFCSKKVGDKFEIDFIDGNFLDFTVAVRMLDDLKSINNLHLDSTYLKNVVFGGKRDKSNNAYYMRFKNISNSCTDLSFDRISNFFIKNELWVPKEVGNAYEYFIKMLHEDVSNIWLPKAKRWYNLLNLSKYLCKKGNLVLSLIYLRESVGLWFLDDVLKPILSENQRSELKIDNGNAPNTDLALRFLSTFQIENGRDFISDLCRSRNNVAHAKSLLYSIPPSPKNKDNKESVVGKKTVEGFFKQFEGFRYSKIDSLIDFSKKFFMNGSVYLASSFSLNMFKNVISNPSSEFSPRLSIVSLSRDQFVSALSNGTFKSYVGHKSTAEYLSNLLGCHVPYNRDELSLKSGDTLYVLQTFSRLKIPNSELTLNDLINMEKNGQLGFLKISVKL